LVLGSEVFVRKVLGDDDKQCCVDSDSNSSGYSRQLAPEAILEAVCRVLQVPITSIKSPGRHQNRAREIAILLCRDFVDEPLDRTAERFGQVSRSTISDTVRRCRQRADRFPAFASIIESVNQSLQGGLP
jgi:chromosomal replication initiation ATPase DnaA